MGIKLDFNGNCIVFEGRRHEHLHRPTDAETADLRANDEFADQTPAIPFLRITVEFLRVLRRHPAPANFPLWKMKVLLARAGAPGEGMAQPRAEIPT
jgi:hypothetical protein